MRIISGAFKGFQFPVYKGTNTRPTTDQAKESLFSLLEHELPDFETLRILDLFAGTGNIGLEFLSRSASSLTSIDAAASNIRYMNEIKSKLEIENWQILKQNVFRFLEIDHSDYDVIFADPPYDLPEFQLLVSKLLDLESFKKGNTLLIVEHPERLIFNRKELFLNKKYGQSCLSFFKNSQHEK